MKQNLIIKERRDDIDFLKSIAIIFVVLYHTYVLFSAFHNNLFNSFKFGFLGVDIFFVISGYLICHSVLPKIIDNSFSFKSFISRRYFRIVPPLLIVCLVSILLGYFLLPAIVFRELVIEAANAVIFIGNFRLANSFSYFGIAVSDRVLLHTWYLAITFQFYILFPLLLLCFRKLFGENNLGKAILAVTVLLIAIAYFLSLDGNGYLKTECRIWELFIGALLYSNQKLITNIYSKFKVPTKLLSTLVVGIIILSILFMNHGYGTWYLTNSILIVVVTSIFVSCKAPTKVFSNSIFNFIGKSSYSIYLWHWPLLIFLLKTKITTLDFYYLYIFAIILVISSLTYFYCERKKYPFSVTAVMLVILAVIYAFYNKNDCQNYLSRLNSLPEYEYQNKTTLDVNIKKLSDNLSIFEYTKDNKTPNFFLIGDSHTGVLTDFVLHQSKPFYVYYQPGTMAYGKYFANMKNTIFEVNRERFAVFYNTYKETLSLLKPGDSVIISQYWYIYKSQFLKENKLDDNEESTELFINALIADLDEQIKLHPNLKFFIVGNGITISETANSFAQLDLTNSFLHYFVNSSNLALQKDLLNDFSNLLQKKLQAYALTRKNVFVIDRRNALKASENSYYIIKNNYSLFKDTNHNQSYGTYLVGKYIFDEVNKQNEHNLQLQAH